MIWLVKEIRELIVAIAGHRKQGMVGGLIVIGVGFIERWTRKCVSSHVYLWSGWSEVV
jgi:hypothetical protein